MKNKTICEHFSNLIFKCKCMCKPIPKKIFDSENLYHFTKYDSALKILLSQTLLFGKCSEMNDINESIKIFCHTNLSKNDSAERNKIIELENYQQLSFTMDIDQTQRGFELSSMWGYYAEKGLGACLVFDKEILLNSLNGKEYTHKKIEYTNDVSQWKSIDENLDDIFFKKFPDWKHENEYRIILKTKSKDNEKICIRRSLKAIIVIRDDNGFPFKNSNEYIYMDNILAFSKLNIPIFTYGSFCDEYILKSTNTDEKYTKYLGWQESFISS